MREVATSGSWPHAIDLPTGTGKTATLDVAIFHIALEVTKGANGRAPVRVAFLVDRRPVVNDTYTRACRISAALRRQAAHDVVRRVASLLATLAETPDEPLRTVRLLGGMAKEPEWTRTPTQPTIIVSTIDRVGSRVFFRGYGISDTMKPIHAGLLGVDTLFLVDEPQASQAFVDTLRVAQDLHRPGTSILPRRPVQVVTLSATQTAENAFNIAADDRADHELSRRLTASKPTELVRVHGNEQSDAQLDTIAENALAMSVVRGGPCTTVGVIVNVVARARAVHERIQQRLRRQGARLADVTILIGRCRDLDRERVVARVLSQVAAGRPPAINAPPVFLIATQCVEADADVDLDGLVTELAPIDSLRQRFGRLDRRGQRGAAPAVIVATNDQLRARPTNPLYGGSLRETWALLTANSTQSQRPQGERLEIDMGIDAASRWLPGPRDLTPYLAQKGEAPVLLPVHFDAWTHTSPVPGAEADVALFLHGSDSGQADVEIVWRADVVEGGTAHEWKDRARVCPPSSLEAVSVPLCEAQAWLRGTAFPYLSDLEGGPSPEQCEHAIPGDRALRWLGIDGDSEIVRAADLKPGDRLVVPATRGGCDIWGWNPQSKMPVSDLGSEANAKQRGWDILRLSPELATAVEPGVDEGLIRELLDRLRNESDEDAYEAIRDCAACPSLWRAYGSRRPAPMLIRSEREGEDGVLLAFHRRWQFVGDAVTEDDESVRCNPGSEALLSHHSKGVQGRATEMALAAGLPKELVSDIALAALLHDAGKAHPQFRSWLSGGQVLVPDSEPVLAKTWRQLGPGARVRSGLPNGARHEVASVYLAVAHPAFSQAHDPELVLWLIGTHHGYGRPFFPAVVWPPPGDVFTVDLGDCFGEVGSQAGQQVEHLGFAWVDSFEHLKRKYGPWGLAWLESLLRLADHRWSEAEQQGQPRELDANTER